MKEVLLSHDSEVQMYLVPDEVAEQLREYCIAFTDWIWNNPNGAKLLVDLENGEKGAMYGADDFIDYLNEWLFPTQKSRLVQVFDFNFYEIPKAYQMYPQFNF